MSQPFLHLWRCFCCPHPDSTSCVPSTVNCHLSSLAPGSPAWAGPPSPPPTGPSPLRPGPAFPLHRLRLSLSLCLSVSLCHCLCVFVSPYLSLSLSVCPLSPSVSHFLSLCLSGSHHRLIISLCPSLCVPISVCLPLYLSLSLLTGHSYVFLMFYFRITKSHPTKSQINVWTIQHKKWRGTGAFTPHPGDRVEPEQKLVNQETKNTATSVYAEKLIFQLGETNNKRDILVRNQIKKK